MDRKKHGGLDAPPPPSDFYPATEKGENETNIADQRIRSSYQQLSLAHIPQQQELNLSHRYPQNDLTVDPYLQQQSEDALDRSTSSTASRRKSAAGSRVTAGSVAGGGINDNIV